MSARVRGLLAVMLACTAWIGLAPAPAVAARSLSLSLMTPVPQVGGEITLRGVISGDEPDIEVAIEEYVARRWTTLGTAQTDARGEFFDTRPATTSGLRYFRLTVPADTEEPAVVSPTLRVSTFAPATTGFDTTSIPTVSGSMTVGSVLAADPGSWTPKADYFTYRWNRNGVSTGKTGRTYTLTGSDLDAYVTVTVNGWRSGAMTLRDSRPTTRVARGTFTTTVPEIVGRAVVGQTLAASVSGWKPTPTSITHQWRRDGLPIEGATSDHHTVTADDAGTTLTVVVHAEAPGVEPVDVASAGFVVPAAAGAPERTFADVMTPYADEVRADVEFTTGSTAPAWGTLTTTPWDRDGAFTHSQRPQPYGTLTSAIYGKPWQRPDYGAEYPGTNASLKNADVTFTVTARRFAIIYRGNTGSDAMVWIDGQPISANPIVGVGPTTSNGPNWIAVTLPTPQTVTVRFAGPKTFSGVATPTAENATIAAAEPGFTLGVLSDSFFEACSEALCQARNAAPVLSTLTGFRVWNMSESATGYVRPGPGGPTGFESSRYGSDKRIEGVRTAPIDALLVAGSINDGLHDPAAHAPAVRALLEDLARVRPDLPIVLVGIEPMRGFDSSWWVSRASLFTSNLRATVGRHQNVVGFIDPYTNPWLTGTGTITSPTGDGNRDQYVGLDGAHLSIAGTRYYQERIVAELRALPLPTAE